MQILTVSDHSYNNCWASPRWRKVAVLRTEHTTAAADGAETSALSLSLSLSLSLVLYQVLFHFQKLPLLSKSTLVLLSIL